jgi:hypothetical protein
VVDAVNRPSCYGTTAKQSPQFRSHKCINCLYLLDCVEKETMMKKSTRPDCYGTRPKPETVLWDERNCLMCDHLESCSHVTFGGSGILAIKPSVHSDDDASFWQCVDCKKNYTHARAALDCCGASPGRRVPAGSKLDATKLDQTTLSAPEVSVWPCKVCDKLFDDPYQRGDHYRLEHTPKSDVGTKLDTLPCVGCGEPLNLVTVGSHACSLKFAKGIDPRKEVGTKLDATKPRWSLLPSGTIAQVIAVLEYGAKKYAVNNWIEVPDAKTRYYDAAMRHLDAWHRGEVNDEESGLPHLAHAACCLLFLMWFDGKSVS